MRTRPCAAADRPIHGTTETQLSVSHAPALSTEQSSAVREQQLDAGQPASPRGVGAPPVATHLSECASSQAGLGSSFRENSGVLLRQAFGQTKQYICTTVNSSRELSENFLISSTLTAVPDTVQVISTQSDDHITISSLPPVLL